MKKKVATQKKKKLHLAWIEEVGFAVPLTANPSGKFPKSPSMLVFSEKRTPGRISKSQAA